MWKSHAKGIGERLTARFSGHELEGVFEDLDEGGHLLLRGADGTMHRIAAADIFFDTLDKIQPEG